MSRDDFWEVLEEARAALKEEPRDSGYLKDVLLGMPRQDIESFYVHYASVLDELDTYNVYALGCILNGGVLTDDAFEYFRGWLVLAGRQVVALALSDPDSIAENSELVVRLADLSIEYESFYYFVEDVYQEKFGESIYDIPLPLEEGVELVEYPSFNEVVKKLPNLTRSVDALRAK